MEDIVDPSSNESPVRAVLVGGPASLPEPSRIRTVSSRTDKIKIEHHAGYEHFERLADPDGAAGPAEIHFHWTMRTEAAE